MELLFLALLPGIIGSYGGSYGQLIKTLTS